MFTQDGLNFRVKLEREAKVRGRMKNNENMLKVEDYVRDFGIMGLTCELIGLHNMIT
jgi:hypothetical protein